MDAKRGCLIASGCSGTILSGAAPEAPVHTRFPCPARVAGPAEPHGVFHCDTGRNAAAVSEHGIHITKLSERWGILIALDTRAIDLSAGV